MSVSENVEVTGHLMDSGILSRVLDDIRQYGGDWVIKDIDLGHEQTDTSHATITVMADDDDALQRLLMRLQTHAVNQIDPGEASVAVADMDGVFPDGFYSTTNLPTRVRLEGRWYDVDNPEMDCGLVVEGERIFTLPMSDVKIGMQVVTGASGIRVTAPVVDKSSDAFGFMESDVSSEKPQAVLVRQVADGMREAKAEGKKVLWVGGPGVVHTGAAPAMVAMVNAGFVDVLFAGNALATHDIESSLYGTEPGRRPGQGPAASSTGTSTTSARSTRSARPARSRPPSTPACSPAGSCTRWSRTRRSSCWSARSATTVPLPDVHTDVIDGQRAMRAELTDVGFCLMVATMLHSVATGNILPASIPLVCVDINPATVTKLADRGSSQAKGIVTDVGLFLEQLAVELVPDYRRA